MLGALAYMDLHGIFSRALRCCVSGFGKIVSVVVILGEI